jgi:Tol biopolymer transport system component
MITPKEGKMVMQSAIIPGLMVAIIIFNACSADDSELASIPTTPGNVKFEERWASSENLQITINQRDKPKVTVTSGYWDYKPSWSKTGDKLTFFRFVSKDRGFHTWRTKICVVNIDGTGFRELTTGDYPHFNPTWARDGSNRIIFNRHSTKRGWKNQIFMIPPDGTIGDEQLVSHPSNAYYEWAFSALKDGRIFIDRKGSDFAKTFLLTPNPGNLGKYEEIKCPTEKLWHKLSVSPSETKVTYMLDNDRKLYTYKDVVIAIADFDIVNLRIENQIIITEMNTDYIYEYPRWTQDESCVIYDSNKSGKYQIYAYHLENKTTTRISPDINRDYRFANFENLPK